MDIFIIALQLCLRALVPIALTEGFYLLNKWSKFKDLKYIYKQIIIGVAFGLAACFATECGVKIPAGANINTRDAAPLLAGLVFGGPAGIIAGVIGGAHRALSVLWIPNTFYSQIACSISTLISGLYAAGLRKWMFDDKRPSWGFALAIGVVMEVIHMAIMFITHIDSPEQALIVVETATIPMVLANALATMVGVILVNVSSHHLGSRKPLYRKITSQVQTWLLAVIVISYFATTAFVYAIQTGNANESAKTLLTLGLNDTVSEVNYKSDENMKSKLKEASSSWLSYADIEKTNEKLSELASQLKVSEINIIEKQGDKYIVTISSDENLVLNQFEMTGDQAGAFNVLLDPNYTDSYFIQPFQARGAGDGNYKYGGVKIDDTHYMQVGYSNKDYQNEVTKDIQGITSFKHIGQTGYIIVYNSMKGIVSDLSTHNTNDIGIKLATLNFTEEYKTYNKTFYGEDSLCMYTEIQGYFIISVMPESEVYQERDAMIYVNTFMEVIAYAILFAIIYLLIKKLVVDNIRKVNNDLGEIIGGNLDVVVNVKSNDEFASLSQDINTTVSKLKFLIDETKARINKELMFAQKIQYSTLPNLFPPFPSIHSFDIYGTMDTAKEVGGDFYDFYMLDNDHVAFLIADVSGKGIPAAMFMMEGKTIIKSYAETGIPVNQILTLANQRLCENNEAEMFITCWMAIVDLKTGHVTFSNAGHNAPLIYRRGVGYEYLKQKPGLVLAGMDGIQYRIQEFDLQPGDKIFLYTDGVTEATRGDNAQYGEERLLNYVNEHCDSPLYASLQNIRGDIDEFVEGAEQFDDITMVMFHYYGAEGDNADMNKVTRKFDATDENLSAALGFIEEELEKHDVPFKLITSLTVAAEEMYVNVAHYAYKSKGGEGYITIDISVVDNTISITFKDNGVPFNPLAKEDPDITLSAEDRAIGGLGIFMVKKMTDEVRYAYVNSENVFTMIKKF